MSDQHGGSRIATPRRRAMTRCSPSPASSTSRTPPAGHPAATRRPDDTSSAGHPRQTTKRASCVTAASAPATRCSPTCVMGRTGKGYQHTDRVRPRHADGRHRRASTCGECAAACPDGALTNKPITVALDAGQAELEEVESVCPYCGVGCAVNLTSWTRRPTRSSYSRRAAPSSGTEGRGSA